MVDHLPKYIFKKRRIFYFTRRVPKDVRSHYTTDRIVLSLRTRSITVARIEATNLAAKLDDHWLLLRRRMYSDPFERFMHVKEAIEIAKSNAPTFSEAKDIYLKVKEVGRPRTFSTAINRAHKNLITIVGDKPIDMYSRHDANKLRDAYAKKNLSKATIHRAFNVIAVSSSAYSAEQREAKNMSQSEIEKLCSSLAGITSLGTASVKTELEPTGMLGSTPSSSFRNHKALKALISNGNWQIGGPSVRKNNQCWFDVVVSGVYNGNSHNTSFTCEIQKFSVANDGSANVHYVSRCIK
ncbi:DUF6538 domain-containing protein [Terasakiella sp. SH-1]|uniref:DUF6538 domain-containing protein n=1 Tax=Terasakiella sp. SH-1 TaxID=2560057 RepID=UPI0010737022|nr:DUF6538 domain-containing protein [Terasakiella sp. SH-1]